VHNLNNILINNLKKFNKMMNFRFVALILSIIHISNEAKITESILLNLTRMKPADSYKYKPNMGEYLIESSFGTPEQNFKLFLDNSKSVFYKFCQLYYQR